MKTFADPDEVMLSVRLFHNLGPVEANAELKTCAFLQKAGGMYPYVGECKTLLFSFVGMSAFRYSGARLFLHLYMISPNLYWIHSLILSK